MIIVVYGFFAFVNEYYRRCSFKNCVLNNKPSPGICTLSRDRRRNRDMTKYIRKYEYIGMNTKPSQIRGYVHCTYTL